MRRKRAREPDEVDRVTGNLDKYVEDNEKYHVQPLKDVRKEFQKVISKTKKAIQVMDEKQTVKRCAGVTRSGTSRVAKSQPTYSDGRWVNKGIDDSSERLDSDEQEYLKKQLNKVSSIKNLSYDQIRYLIMYVLLDDLKSIKEGKTQSRFHDAYKKLMGKSKNDIYADLATSLFTNEQRDYIHGVLQGAFGTTTKDEHGDIKHADIAYVKVVILAEVVIRIVKYVHKFETNEEAYDYMVKCSYEANGLADDYDG